MITPECQNKNMQGRTLGDMILASSGLGFNRLKKRTAIPVTDHVAAAQIFEKLYALFELASNNQPVFV